MDERKLAQALARFEGFRKNIPPAIRENVVDDYHRIVDAIAEATGEDLSVFKIQPDELKPKLLSVRPGSFSGRPGSAHYSTDKYCDDSRFQSQVDSLAEYLERIGHRRDLPQPLQKSRPSAAPTYNIGSMIGSAIQHGTRDSRIAVNYDAKSSEFRELVQQIKAAIPQLCARYEVSSKARLVARLPAVFCPR